MATSATERIVSPCTPPSSIGCRGSPMSRTRMPPRSPRSPTKARIPLTATLDADVPAGDGADVGTPRKGSNLWLSWKRLLKRLGLPDFKFHELRHTSASLTLSEGASLFHVSRMLGHSSIAITADTYGHWTDEGREDVALRLERA